MKSVVEIRNFARNNMLTKKDKNSIGHIDYKVISKVNIDKFMEPMKTYYSSYELWTIAKEMFPSIVEEMKNIQRKTGMQWKDIDRIYLEEFSVCCYDGSICEAISTWFVKYAPGFVLIPVSDDDDRNFGIDVRALCLRNNQLIQIQVKKKPPVFTNDWWREVDDKLDKAQKKFVIRPDVFVIDFDEVNRMKRSLTWYDRYNRPTTVSFPKSFGRSQHFQKQFNELIDLMSRQEKYDGPQNEEVITKENLSF